jgi:rSAM/selenodomain-associated transferase 2
MRVSIIIPTLNEVAVIAQTISRTRALGDCEVIVVDGGSDDGTLEAARAADLRLSSGRGRALQQNWGAGASRGDLLIFLHADCWLEPGALAAVRSTFDDPRTIGACFRQTIDSTGMIYRLIEAGNKLRVRTVQWAYGDQGIVVRRDIFERVGGFPQLPLMEDLYLMKRLKREGRVRLIDHSLHVHPRRWQNTGPVRQSLRNWLFIALAHGGVSPATLARYYAHVR